MNIFNPWLLEVNKWCSTHISRFLSHREKRELFLGYTFLKNNLVPHMRIHVTHHLSEGSLFPSVFCVCCTSTAVLWVVILQQVRLGSNLTNDCFWEVNWQLDILNMAWQMHNIRRSLLYRLASPLHNRPHYLKSHTSRKIKRLNFSCDAQRRILLESQSVAYILQKGLKGWADTFNDRLSPHPL